MDQTEEVKNNKKVLRKEIAELKKTVSFELKQELSNIIMTKLETLPEFNQAKTILLYYALGDEVQTELFLKKWFNQGKKIVLPVVSGDDLILKEYVPDMMGKGYLSISEPSGTTVINPKEIELAIIPGVAFDASCNRMGRGRGFYDRLLPNIKCQLIGVSYDFQIVNKVPIDNFDRKLNKVITESTIYCA